MLRIQCNNQLCQFDNTDHRLRIKDILIGLVLPLLLSTKSAEYISVLCFKQLRLLNEGLLPIVLEKTALVQVYDWILCRFKISPKRDLADHILGGGTMNTALTPKWIKVTQAEENLQNCYQRNFKAETNFPHLFESGIIQSLQ